MEYINKFFALKFTNKKQATFCLFIMWLTCFFISIFFAAHRYNMSVISIFTEHMYDLLPAIIFLPIAFLELIFDLAPFLENSMILLYFVFIAFLIIAHVKIIAKHSVQLFALLFAVLLTLSYHWIYTALELSGV